MMLESISGELVCRECDTEIDESGYLPATKNADTYDPIENQAVCTGCGFNDLGFAGCAPELTDVIDPAPDDVLLQIRVTDAGIEILSTKE